jgi:tRNA threonylcarbamoyl adenosine modification protein YeaZ
MKKNILAVSACLKRCSIAFLYEEKIYEVNECVDAAANLVWLADDLAKTNNIDFRKIDGVISASGPGSFTGIRAAQSFAKGFAMSLKLPSVGVSYFDVIRKIHVPGDVLSAVLINGENDKIYYKIGDDFGAATAESLKDKIPNGAVLVGDAVNTFPGIIPVTDFRDARHLLHFSDLITAESEISPLYT